MTEKNLWGWLTSVFYFCWIDLYNSLRDVGTEFEFSHFLCLTWDSSLHKFCSILICYLLDFVSGTSLQIPDAAESVVDDNDEENSMMATIKGKCITQLLLLGAIDSIQVKINVKQSASPCWIFCWWLVS